MVTTPSAASGGIMKFAQKRLTCLGCKAPLAKGDATVCKHCKDKVGCRPSGCACSHTASEREGAAGLSPARKNAEATSMPALAHMVLAGMGMAP